MKQYTVPVFFQGINAEQPTLQIRVNIMANDKPHARKVALNFVAENFEFRAGTPEKFEPRKPGKVVDLSSNK